MGTKSTCVKSIARYEVEYEDGTKERVMEVAFVDPAQPLVLHLTKDVVMSLPLEVINLEIKL